MVKNTIGHISDAFCNLANIKDGVSYDNLLFIAEQLKLRTMAKQRYRYSGNTTIFASLMHSISPHVYKFLRSYSSLILPHPQTIKFICNAFLTDFSNEEKEVFLTYAKNMFKNLSENEKYLILLMDKTHIQPYLDYKGGNIYGTIYINTFCTNEDIIQEISVEQEVEYSWSKNITVELDDIDKIKQAEISVVTYLAGYCCYLL